jgi:hypothetical protein
MSTEIVMVDTSDDIKHRLQLLEKDTSSNWNTWDLNNKKLNCRTGMLHLEEILQGVDSASWVLEDFVKLIEFLGITEVAVKVVTRLMLQAGDGESGISAVRPRLTYQS